MLRPRCQGRILWRLRGVRATTPALLASPHQLITVARRCGSRAVPGARLLPPAMTAAQYLSRFLWCN